MVSNHSKASGVGNRKIKYKNDLILKLTRKSHQPTIHESRPVIFEMRSASTISNQRGVSSLEQGVVGEWAGKSTSRPLSTFKQPSYSLATLYNAPIPER
jgi:hypothetical protein